MPIPTYTLGYPPDGSSLGQTKTTIRNNLDGTFETLAIDHVDNNGQPGSQPAGYHTIIHEVPQTNVSTIAGYNQLFSGVPGTLSVNSVTTPEIPPGGDEQLYSLTGGGKLAQLTGSIYVYTPFTANNGYFWAGGFLFQWGVKFSPGATGNVLFSSPNINFPTACYMVQITADRGGTTSAQQTSLNGPPLKTGFSYTGSGAGPNAIYWLAIGN
jgi:hypothetical protein